MDLKYKSYSHFANRKLICYTTFYPPAAQVAPPLHPGVSHAKYYAITSDGHSDGTRYVNLILSKLINYSDVVQQLDRVIEPLIDICKNFLLIV